MKQIRDALELLTAQHEELDDLLDDVMLAKDSATFATFADKLTTHLAAEQELLYPVIAKQIPLDVLDELLAEHAAIKRVLADLVWRSTEDPEFAHTLTSLADLINGHCAWQEEELFLRAAETMSPAELESLCESFYAFETFAVAA